MSKRLLTILENFVKRLEVCHDDIPMLFENRQCNEEMEVGAQIVGPEGLPQSQNVHPLELAFVPDQNHPEEEEEIGDDDVVGETFLLVINFSS